MKPELPVTFKSPIFFQVILNNSTFHAGFYDSFLSGVYGEPNISSEESSLEIIPLLQKLIKVIEEKGPLPIPSQYSSAPLSNYKFSSLNEVTKQTNQRVDIFKLKPHSDKSKFFYIYFNSKFIFSFFEMYCKCKNNLNVLFAVLTFYYFF